MTSRIGKVLKTERVEGNSGMVAPEKTSLRRAERFFGIIFVVSTVVSVVSFAGLLTVSALRTSASETQGKLLTAQTAIQQVTLRLGTLDLGSQDNLNNFANRSQELRSAIEDLSTDVTSNLRPHPVLISAEERIGYWAQVLTEEPNQLNFKRAKNALQDSAELLGDELLLVEQELGARGITLQRVLVLGYVVMGASILLSVYFLAILFMSIRSILVWDEKIILSFSKKEKTKSLPTITIPMAKVFPGSALLTDQSHVIATNFQKQVEQQRQLAKKNKVLSERLGKTVNELVDSREEFARSSQLAAVGKVAGSVSHEINNPVTGVLGYLAFIKKRSTDDSLVVWIDKAIKEVERIGRIARSLLVFSRHSATQAPAAFDIGPVVDNVVTLVGPQMREAEVEVVVDPITNVPQAIGRVDELQQCLLNVLLNARYALLDKPQKTIWVEMSSTKDAVQIAIRDSGTGIPAKVQEHLFQPFYTTKPAGQGSGLGLAVAKELMTGMGGTIVYDKTYGPGAKFVLSVPIYDEAKAAKAAKSAKAAEVTAAEVAGAKLDAVSELEAAVKESVKEAVEVASVVAPEEIQAKVLKKTVAKKKKA